VTSLRGDGRSAPSSVHVSIDWDALRPKSFYARVGRPALNAMMLVACLPFALPPLALITLVNALHMGGLRKAFYVQSRVGHRGRVFDIFKFRTMREASGSDVQSWADGSDRARVTTLGRFLRSTHLDELPQLFNILRGDMTFIGPRPEMLEIEEWAGEAVPGFGQRLAMKPGITGFAQITQGYTGLDVDAYRRKFEINEIYRRNVRLRVDVEIVLRTAVWMLRGRGWDWNDTSAVASARQRSRRTESRDASGRAAA
jgi:lipopolysaccharide/colanic/teichoic acid biosynthesis glycosyltransferase